MLQSRRRHRKEGRQEKGSRSGARALWRERMQRVSIRLPASPPTNQPSFYLLHLIMDSNSRSKLLHLLRWCYCLSTAAAAFRIMFVSYRVIDCCLSLSLLSSSFLYSASLHVSNHGSAVSCCCCRPPCFPETTAGPQQLERDCSVHQVACVIGIWCTLARSLDCRCDSRLILSIG